MVRGVIAAICLIVLLLAGRSTAAPPADGWVQVRSKNFLLIGNAPEKEIDKVARDLERFRSTLSQVFNIDLSSPIPSYVVVFNDDSAYTPYKPLRKDGKVDSSVQGYFRYSGDANYIAVSIGKGEDEALRTIFHEYVHFAVSRLYPHAEVPTWFNEGIAEYYSTFALNDARGTHVGAPISAHVQRLAKDHLLPLSELFRLQSSDVSNGSEETRSLFYAESWGLVHYLLDSGQGPQLNELVRAVLNGVPVETAVKDAFGRDERTLETAFKAYVARSSYRVATIETRDADQGVAPVQGSSLTPARTASYLGDLLYHLDRAAEAEALLLRSLNEEPSNTLANGSLGLIRLQQQRLDEARHYLGIAAADQEASAPILYRYAYALSRDALDGPEHTKPLPAETIRKIRTALHRAITMAPALAESYDLLAAVDLLDNDDLDEAAASMAVALRLEPKRVCNSEQGRIRESHFAVAEGRTRCE